MLLFCVNEYSCFGNVFLKKGYLLKTKFCANGFPFSTSKPHLKTFSFREVKFSIFSLVAAFSFLFELINIFHLFQPKCEIQPQVKKKPFSDASCLYFVSISNI
jgi:hypothetical protein